MTPFRSTEPRPAEQIVGGFVPVVLAGQEYTLPVLPIRDNRTWTQAFQRAIADKLAELPPLNSIDEVAGMLAASMDVMMDLLIAYDRDGLLPDRETIDTTATDREVYESLKRVTAAAFPFGVDLRTLVPELMPSLLRSLQSGVALGIVAASSRSTSGSQRNTAGHRQKSKPA